MLEQSENNCSPCWIWSSNVHNNWMRGMNNILLLSLFLSSDKYSHRGDCIGCVFYGERSIPVVKCILWDQYKLHDSVR